MALLINLRHLDDQNLELADTLPVAELDIDTHDELIRLTGPLQYDLDVQQVEAGLLLEGSLRLMLECECARCLKPFRYELTLSPWTRLIPLEGEEAAPVINDCVDLTPYVREDILLEFPQHPLCNTECGGLPTSMPGRAGNSSSVGQPETGSPAWDELNKLKF